jgi:hypothetical protein
MPYPNGPDKLTETVQVWGVDERFTQVTGFEDILYWRPTSQAEVDTMQEDDPRRWINMSSEDGGPTTAEKLLRDGLALHNEAADKEGIVLGMHVSSANERAEDGSYRQMGGGTWWMPGFEVTVLRLGTLVDASKMRGEIDPMWLSEQDAVRAVRLALNRESGTGANLSKWSVLHISSKSPNARFRIARANRTLGYEPAY